MCLGKYIVVCSTLPQTSLLSQGCIPQPRLLTPILLSPWSLRKPNISTLSMHTGAMVQKSRSTMTKTKPCLSLRGNHQEERVDHTGFCAVFAGTVGRKDISRISVWSLQRKTATHQRMMALPMLPLLPIRKGKGLSSWSPRATRTLILMTSL